MGLNDSGCCRSVAEVGLVQNHEVCCGQLAPHRLTDIVVDDLDGDRFDVGQHDDQVEPVGAPMAVRRNAGGVGNPARFDDHSFWPWVELGEIVERSGEAIDQRAADAPVWQGDRRSVPLIEELRIDVEGAEVVDQDSDALICECEQVVEQRGLAGAEVAPDDRDGDERFAHVSRYLQGSAVRRRRCPRRRCL